MAEALSGNKVVRIGNATEQLSLPLELDRFKGGLVFYFEEDIQPENLRDILTNEGISCIADLRKVPFFRGNSDRHKKLNKIISDLGIPVFHIGVALRSAVDISLPTSLKKKQISEIIKTSDSIKKQIDHYLSSGACLLVVNHDNETIDLSIALASVFETSLDNVSLKLNRAWASILRAAQD